MRMVMLALALLLTVTEGRAAELRFELKNCHQNPIDVLVYNGRDTLFRLAASSGWQGMKHGETIGFVCDEDGVGYCWADVRIPNTAEGTRRAYMVDVRTTLCFAGHQSQANFIDSRCNFCSP